jgi:hypothetical protein
MVRDNVAVDIAPPHRIYMRDTVAKMPAMLSDTLRIGFICVRQP